MNKQKIKRYQNIIRQVTLDKVYIFIQLELWKLLYI